MYLHSVYIHWNIWLNELFYMINLHWGSLLPTQALNLPKVAKPPAKWCHSEEQRVRGHKLHAALLIWECSCDLYIKQADRTLSDFIREFFGHGGRGAGTVYFFPNQQLQGTWIVVSSQTLVPRSQSASTLWMWSILDLLQHTPGSAAWLSWAVIMNRMCWFT